MILIIIAALALEAVASPMYQSVAVKDDGSYRFSFETGKDGGSHSRIEERNAEGIVHGKYSYEDPNGAIREVSYRADDQGYVANGDVSVEGAPRSQFPVLAELQNESPSLAELGSQDEPVAFKAAEPTEIQGDKPQETADTHVDEETHKDEEIHELPSEDSTANDPPEAFPEGFFLQHFQGLRRLPEPTKDSPASTTVSEEASSAAETSSESPQDQKSTEENGATTTAVTESSHAPNEELNRISRDPTSDMELFMHLRRPFQGFNTPHWAPSMLHQPVYVFSYQHPESFGYHYFY